MNSLLNNYCVQPLARSSRKCKGDRRSWLLFIEDKSEINLRFIKGETKGTAEGADVGEVQGLTGLASRVPEASNTRVPVSASAHEGPLPK